MPKPLEILITSSISIIATILWQNYQFLRGHKFNYKIKLRNIRLLLRESIQQGEYDLKGAQKFVEEIESTPWIVPAIYKFPYESITILAQNVLSDDYYSAYSTVLKKVSSHQEYYYQLKILSNAISRNLTSRYELVIKSQQDDLTRRKEYTTITNRIRNLVLDRELTTDSNKIKKNDFLVIVEKWLDLRRDNINIEDIQNMLILPFIKLYTSSTTKDDIYFLCVDAFHLYHEIEQFNKQLASAIQELIEQCQREINRLKEWEKFFISSEIKNLYA